MKLVYHIVYAFWYLLSLLPLRVLYILSDIVYYPLYYVVRYRIRIEKDFYAWFCDYVVETIKELSMSKEQMSRRMTFSGVDDIAAAMEKEGKNFCFIYLGHYGNWEWMASLPLWCPEDV